MLGALIGLLFVCIVDFIFPPKHSMRKTFPQSSDAVVSANDDIPEDDLDDLSSSEGDNDDSKKQPTPSPSPSKQKSKGTIYQKLVRLSIFICRLQFVVKFALHFSYSEVCTQYEFSVTESPNNKSINTKYFLLLCRKQKDF